jgi:fatty acid desaturase
MQWSESHLADHHSNDYESDNQDSTKQEHTRQHPQSLRSLEILIGYIHSLIIYPQLT